MIDELTAEHADRTTTLHRLDHRLRQVDAELAAGPTAAEIAELQTGWRELSSQIDAAARQRVAGYRSAPPAYLVTALGPPPADHGAGRWHKTATTVEDYRLRWNVNDPDQPLGGAPTDPLQQADHRHAAATIEHHRREQQLQRDERAPQPQPRHPPQPVSYPQADRRILATTRTDPARITCQSIRPDAVDTGALRWHRNPILA